MNVVNEAKVPSSHYEITVENGVLKRNGLVIKETKVGSSTDDEVLHNLVVARTCAYQNMRKATTEQAQARRAKNRLSSDYYAEKSELENQIAPLEKEKEAFRKKASNYYYKCQHDKVKVAKSKAEAKRIEIRPLQAKLDNLLSTFEEKILAANERLTKAGDSLKAMELAYAQAERDVRVRRAQTESSYIVSDPNPKIDKLIHLGFRGAPACGRS